MDNPVEDGIGGCRLADAVRPFGDRILTGNKGGLQAVAIFHELQKVPPFLFGQGVNSPVVDSQEIDLGEPAEDLVVTAVAAGESSPKSREER